MTDRPINLPLIQVAPGVIPGKNLIRGSFSIPNNVFLSRIIIRNRDAPGIAAGITTWSFNCFVGLQLYDTDDKLETLYDGDVAGTIEFEPIFDVIQFYSDTLNISKPVPFDSNPSIFIQLEEDSVAHVAYTPLVAEIYYTKYLHPVSSSSDFQRLEKTITDKIDETHSNGLRYAGRIRIIASRTSSGFAIGTTTIPTGEVWQITTATINLNGDATWQLGTSNAVEFPLIRVTTGWTPTTHSKDLWLIRGEGIYLSEIDGAVTCYYTINGVRWTIL